MAGKTPIHAECGEAQEPFIRATSMSVTSCDCGSISVLLHDSAGQVFAVGTLDLAAAMTFMTDYTDEIQKRLDEAVAARGGTISSEVH